MAYIGRGLDKISNVEVLDNITFDGSSTSFTLQKGGVNFTPSSANNILVSIDGVVQAGNFTCSGSTIDFGVAVSASSVCNFIIHYGVGVITEPSDNSVTAAKIPNGVVSNAHLAGSIDLTSKVTGVLPEANSLQMTPSFKAHRNSNFTASDSTTTVIVCDDEEWDTDSAYDTSTGKFTVPSGKAGKYVFYASARNATSNDTTRFVITIRKGGTGFAQANNNNGDEDSAIVCGSTTLAVGDEVDCTIYQNTGSSRTIFGDNPDKTTFFGFRIIGA